jgi:hypothetical protein
LSAEDAPPLELSPHQARRLFGASITEFRWVRLKTQVDRFPSGGYRAAHLCGTLGFG